MRGRLPDNRSKLATSHQAVKASSNSVRLTPLILAAGWSLHRSNSWGARGHRLVIARQLNDMPGTRSGGTLVAPGRVAATACRLARAPSALGGTVLEAPDLILLVRDCVDGELPGLIGQLEGAKAAAWARLAGAPQGPERNAKKPDDRNLDVAEAASRLGISRDWLYRNAGRLPFAVRIGRRVLFSANGLERWNRSSAPR